MLSSIIFVIFYLLLDFNFVLFLQKKVKEVFNMFENDFFEKWLETQSKICMEKISKGKNLSFEEMIILVLKAQSNHFLHLDTDLRVEINDLRLDMDKRFEQVDKRFEQVDKRFEQVDKRFEQVDKRFEQVDKRFEQFERRFDKLQTVMMWGFGLMFTGIILPVVLDFIRK